MSAPRQLSSFKQQLPNVLSMFRLCCVPVVVTLLWALTPEPTAHNVLLEYWAATLFIVAGISDILDGFFARRHQTISDFGKLFDPLADKLMTLGVLVMLIPLGRMAAWLVVIHVVRETMVTSLRGIAASDGIVIAASKWGKMKNAFSTVGLAMLIAHEPLWGVHWVAIGWVLFWVATMLSIISGVDYTIQFLRKK